MNLDACCFGDQVDHACATPWLRQVDRKIIDGDDRGTSGIDGGGGDESLGEVHHVGVVGKGLVQLHHRELRVVARGDSFVAEYTSDFKDSLHAANDEALEVQLECDAQVLLHVEGVVVCDEWTSMCTACFHMQHGGFYFGELATMKRATETGDDFVANRKHAAGFFVADEVCIALAVTGIGIGEAVPFVGKRADSLCKQNSRIHLDGQLAFASRHHGASCSDPVTEVEVVDGVELLVADNSFGHEQLNG